jgi:hypothetical protein
MIITTQPKPKQHIYPWLGINAHNFIVLFYADNMGTVLRSPGRDFLPSVGYYSTKWNMGDFQEFNGTITLEN